LEKLGDLMGKNKLKIIKGGKQHDPDDEDRYSWVNDEPTLPSVTQDFVERIKKVIVIRDEKDALLVEKLGIYGADLAIRILRDHPDLTVEEVIQMVDEL
jgi:hypothetical protein